MNYQRQQQPGCGGCLLIAILLLLIPGGASFLGSLVSFGLTFFLILIAGFMIFSYYMKKKIVDYQNTQTESHNRFVWLLVHILVHIAKFDGKITKEEITTIQRFFQYNLRYDQVRMRLVRDIIKEASSSTESLESLLTEFKSSFAYEPRLILLELIYQVMYSNANVSEKELETARKIAKYLDITEYDQRTIETKYRYGQQQSAGQSAHRESDYYATLGLEKGADFATIKKAYRKLSMQYHPDKVGHLGDEFKKVAEEKMKDINAAYEYFKKQQ